MTKKAVSSVREAMPSIASALWQANRSLRRGDLPQAVYWVRVAADLDEEKQIPA